jgi:hypothetical protein
MITTRIVATKNGRNKSLRLCDVHCGNTFCLSEVAEEFAHVKDRLSKQGTPMVVKVGNTNHFVVGSYFKDGRYVLIATKGK